jgi:hypothetical protein
MKNYKTKQRAYAGKFALLHVASGKLVGATFSPRPKLYENKESATQASKAQHAQLSPCLPVKLV